MQIFYITHLVDNIFFSQCGFSVQKYLGIASEFQSYSMKHLMFRLILYSIEEPMHSLNILQLSILMIVIWFSASGLVSDDLKTISQWEEMLKMLMRSRKSILVRQCLMQLQEVYRT